MCSNHLSERKQAINQSFDQAAQKLVNYQLWSLSDTLEERDSTLAPRSYPPHPALIRINDFHNYNYHCGCLLVDVQAAAAMKDP